MCIGRRIIARINSIIRFVTFAGRGHGGDFGFGAGPGSLSSERSRLCLEPIR